MKKLALLTVCLAGLSACEKPKITENNIKKEKQAVGSDKDDHGCIASAGQTWSELKQDCIQIFNKGFRLNLVEPKKDEAVISAFILMSDDQSALELFLPDHTVILKKTDKNVYKNNQYKYDSDNSILYVDGVERYKGNVE